MIVEDDKDTVRALDVRLKSKGYNWVVAADAISAISTARKETPDLIVLDLGLPGGDGFVVMQRIRSNYELMMIPIIVVSARDPFLNQERAVEAGAETFLQKPVQDADFLAAIEKALSKSAHPV
jgi:DNA-binding response OmpR family regulator